MARKGQFNTHCNRGHLRTPETYGKHGCKICAADRSAEWLKKHPEVLRKANHKYYKNNAEKMKKRSREYNKQHPETYRKRMYGVTKEQFELQLKKQDGKCAVCGIFLDGNERATTPSVDHMHDGEEKFRGILCPLCNSGLGYFKDNVNLLEKAIQYLKETQWNQPFTVSSSAMVLKPEAEKTLLVQPSLKSAATSTV